MPDSPFPRLTDFIAPESYLGEVYALDFEYAWVQLHASYRHRVGGVSHGCMLLATRLAPTDHVLAQDSLILLRVLTPATLPGHEEASHIRASLARQITGNLQHHWDHPATMDTMTHHLFSFSGMKCRILGCFTASDDDNADMQTLFGHDVLHYDDTTGLKVYKPQGSQLAQLLQLLSPEHIQHQTLIGHVRYTAHPLDVTDAAVYLNPTDLIGQKTALFGMTRMGKSTTAKHILRAIFGLRFTTPSQSIGQLVFDANGEYANDNQQDGVTIPSSVRHLWRMHPHGRSDDIVTYGLHQQSHDPDRQMLLLNFFDEAMLAVGKQILDEALADESAKFIQHFRNVRFVPIPPNAPFSQRTRMMRQQLVYRALLVKAGFVVPDSVRPRIRGLFNANLIRAMLESTSSQVERYLQTAHLLQLAHPTWDQLVHALEGLATFINDTHSGYREFAARYLQRSNEAWADDTLHALLTMLRYPQGTRYLARVRHLHTPALSDDYAQAIYHDLETGKLVIIDQSVGDSATNQVTAERVLQAILAGQQAHFRAGRRSPPIILYIEEAHTLLPAGSEHDLLNLWVRTAKEGAKYQIGLVYATQEVTSIQRNILKNTSNWFIGYLNNSDEVRELAKYEDFADLELAIRRANVRGFVRMKTRSQPFTIPVQILPLDLQGDSDALSA